MLKKGFRSIYTKFITVFFLILIIANISSPLIVFRTITKSVYDIVTDNLKNSAYIVKNLVENKNIPLEEIPKYLEETNSMKIYDNLKDINMFISNNQLKTLEKGEAIFIAISDGKAILSSIIMIDKSYVVISPNNEKNPILKLRGLELKLFIAPLMVGSILIAFAVATVVKPIKEISKGSKEIAMGNFNVNIKVKGKDEVAELANNFNLMVKELSKNEYLHKDFVNSVSHEFKTPISSLKGYAKLIKDPNLTDEQRCQYADIIISASEKLSNLSTNLLRLSELENGSLVKKNTEFSLSEQIRSTIILMQNQWEEKNLNLDLDIDEVNYTGDEELLCSVWMNLISNAIKYSKPEGQLSISVKKEDNIIIKISDNGIGVSEEDMENIFLKFFKVDKTRSSTGTGLGLPIAKKIIEFHGGKILLESKLNEGSTFTIIL